MIAAIVAAIAVLPGTAAADAPDYVPGQVIVRYDDGATASQRSDARAQVDGHVAATLSLADTQVVGLPAGASAPDAATALEAEPAVDYAEPDYLYAPATTPNDPSFAAQWNMTTIAAPTAWSETTGSASVKIGIVDTGVDLQQPDLQANLDATQGKDFVGSCPTGVSLGASCGDNDPDDQSGHGTHVAGIAGAAGNNALGVTGVNWTTDLIAERVCGVTTVGGTQVTCPSSAIAAGINDAAAKGAKVLNLSVSGSVLSNSVKAAVDAHPGVLMVAAAGNGDPVTHLGMNLDTTGLNSYPCELAEANVVCVAATTQSDALASYSNYGSSVELAAPGSGVTSTANGGGTTSMSGTSMATPHVAGAAALMLSAVPTATPDQLRTALMSGTHALPALAGKVVSGGRLDLPGSLTAIGEAPPPPPEPPPTTTTQPVTTTTTPAASSAPAPTGGSSSSSTPSSTTTAATTTKVPAATTTPPTTPTTTPTTTTAKKKAKPCAKLKGKKRKACVRKQRKKKHKAHRP